MHLRPRRIVVLVLPLAGLVAGAALWAVAAITALGSVAAQSSDAAHTARVIEAVPGWIGPVKLAGLVVMGLALLTGGVAWLTRK